MSDFLSVNLVQQNSFMHKIHSQMLLQCLSHLLSGSQFVTFQLLSVRNGQFNYVVFFPVGLGQVGVEFLFI